MTSIHKSPMGSDSVLDCEIKHQQFEGVFQEDVVSLGQGAPVLIP